MTSDVVFALLMYLLIAARLAGMVVAAPLLAGALPAKLRVLIVLGVALLITPLHWPWDGGQWTTDRTGWISGPGQQAEGGLAGGTGLADGTGWAPENWLGGGAELALMFAREALLGLAQGLVIRLLVGGLHLAGQLVSQVSGMQVADVFQPDLGTGIPVMSRLLELVTLAVFVSLGGHRQVMACLLDSFRLMPPGQAMVGTDLLGALVEVTRTSFELGIRAAAPVVVAVLVSVLALGFISRSLPQLNVLTVGFGVHTFVMLATLLVSLGAIVLVFEQSVQASLERLGEALAAAADAP